MQATAKITAKGQITLPKIIRQRLKVKAGNIVVFEEEGDKIFIKPALTLRDLKGILKGKSKITDFEEIRKFAKEHVARRVMRIEKS